MDLADALKVATGRFPGHPRDVNEPGVIRYISDPAFPE
jgi:hypothetical protein